MPPWRQQTREYLSFQLFLLGKRLMLRFGIAAAGQGSPRVKNTLLRAGVQNDLLLALNSLFSGASSTLQALHTQDLPFLLALHPMFPLTHAVHTCQGKVTATSYGLNSCTRFTFSLFLSIEQLSLSTIFGNFQFGNVGALHQPRSCCLLS